MVLDPRIAEMLERDAGAPGVRTVPVAEARRGYAQSAAADAGPPDPVRSAVDQVVAGTGGSFAVRVYTPEDAAEPSPAVVYLHGGGWVLGDLETHDGVARALAARTPCVVVSVDYRLAPEHRFPAALEDAWDATAWVMESAVSLGVDPDRVAVAGDSAGGNLAAAVALRARDRGIALALQLLVYPALDHALDTQSYRDLGEAYGLTRESMVWYWAQYVGTDFDADDPEIAPLRAADLSGVAPAYVLTAEYDPLRDEGEAYAHRLADAGVAATGRRFEGVHHGFIRMTGALPQAGTALDEAAAALRAAFASTG